MRVRLWILHGQFSLVASQILFSDLVNAISTVPLVSLESHQPLCGINPTYHPLLHAHPLAVHSKFLHGINNNSTLE